MGSSILTHENILHVVSTMPLSLVFRKLSPPLTSTSSTKLMNASIFCHKRRICEFKRAPITPFLPILTHALSLPVDPRLRMIRGIDPDHR
jgi:hypothetical protein